MDRAITGTAPTTEARAFSYGLMAASLRVPEESFAAAAASQDFAKRLASVGRVLHGAGLEPSIGRISQSVKGLTHQSLCESYRVIFGHSLRGAVTPYECEYGGDEIIKMAQELGDLAGFYAAFGMKVDPKSHERADHIAVELEFMMLLCAQELEAMREEGRTGIEHLAVVRDAERKFLRDHLARWGIAFGRNLSEADPIGYLGSAGAFLEAFLRRECAAMDIAAGPTFLPLSPADGPEALIQSMQCGKPVPVPGAEATEE
ncbi:MAG: molecular chaperone TorD family protein [Planctomycetes bacterium]|nr:molecular chaperone TorD family protein [Planctomycetota bacterium]